MLLFLENFSPELHPIIPHTGGARKARMKAKERGARGGYRVVYYFFEGNTVWFITIYDKVSKEDLSQEEKRHIRGLVQEIRARNEAGSD
ncbi:MAG TPA: type II toxin-antitoxin system RelE/ParE family toxin [Caldilineae bacterium]|nr:type II toxin-antitoxin system RelE/ParE family toxin [Caldilineae bacterium]